MQTIIITILSTTLSLNHDIKPVLYKINSLNKYNFTSQSLTYHSIDC